MRAKILLGTVLIILASCATVEGMGDDMSAAGQGISNSASKVKSWF